MTFRLLAGVLGVALLFTAAIPVRADTFGSGELAFEIPFVTIGDPGNPPDTVTPSGLGAPLPSGTVDYVYRIGKYEVSEQIIDKANRLSEAAGRPLGLEVDVARGPDKPATGLSWFDAARFVNWLNEERGSPSAYKFVDETVGGRTRPVFQLWEPSDPGYDPANPFRNTRAYYFLPSADEWHKAAYYDPAAGDYWLYPYGSDDPPLAVPFGTYPNTAVYNQDGPADVQLAGGENVNGIVGIAGNVYEFEETSVNLINDLYDNPFLMRRGANGGSWTRDLATSLSAAFRNSGGPAASQSTVGLRLASVPEGSSAALLAIVAAATAAHRRIAN